MTEAEMTPTAAAEIPADRKRSAIGMAILTGRVLALTMAFFVLKAVVSSNLSVLDAAQPLVISGILVAAAFAKRSASSLIAVGYVLTFLVFLLLRPSADETFIPIHYDYPILFDRIFFLGSLPMVKLQDLFYVSGRVGILDLALSGVYITYFFAPHLMTLIVWRTRPQLFPKAAVAISLTFMIGLFFYFAVPTAPPWLASDRGDINSDVVRVLPEIITQLAGDTYDQASRAVGTNDVAAMPSLHTGLTAMVALIMAGYGRRWRWVGLIYLALMGTALVYLGEHYVIDEIGGVLLAVGVWKLVSHHRAFAWLSPQAESEDVADAVAVEDKAA